MGFFDFLFRESEAERAAREEKEMLEKQREEEQTERERREREVDAFVADLAKKNGVRLDRRYSSEMDTAPLRWASKIGPRETEYSKTLDDFSPENQKKMRPSQLNRKIKDITNLFLSSPRDQYRNYTRVLDEYRADHDRYTRIRDQWLRAAEIYQSEVDSLDESIEGNRRLLSRLSGGTDRAYGIVNSKNPVEELQRNQDILIEDFRRAYPNKQERIEKFIKLLKDNPDRAIEYLKDSFIRPTENIRREQRRLFDTRDEYDEKLEIVSNRLERYNNLISSTTEKLETEFNFLGISLADYEESFKIFWENLPEKQKEKINKEKILERFRVDCDRLRVSMSKKVEKSGMRHLDGTPVIFKMEKAPTRLTQTSVDTKPELKAEPKPEPKVEPKPEPKAEQPKPEQPKVEPKPEQPKQEPAQKEPDIDKGTVTGGLLGAMKKSLSTGNISEENPNQPSQDVPLRNRPATVPITQQEQSNSKETLKRNSGTKPVYSGFAVTDTLPSMPVEQPKKQEQREMSEQTTGSEKNAVSQDDLAKFIETFNQNREAFEFFINEFLPIIQRYQQQTQAQQHSQSQQQTGGFVKKLGEQRSLRRPQVGTRST